MGFLQDPSYVVQNKIYTGLAAGASRDQAGVMDTADIQTYLSSTFPTVVNPTVFNDFLAQYSNGAPMPSKIDNFVTALVTYVNNHGNTGGTALGSPLPGTANNQIKGFLLSGINAALQLSSPYPDGGTMTAAGATLTVFTDINEQAFNKFIAEFQYQGNTIFGSSGTVSPPNTPARVNQQFFTDRYNEFFFELASVANTTSAVVPGVSGQLLNFQDIFTAYFGNNVTAFQQFLANYIQELVYPANQKGQSFIPSQDIGEWLEKVQNAYSVSLKGSGAPLISSVGQTTRKVDILLTIFALLVKMIGTLQKVAAAQSDRLQLLATWTGSYTNLQTQVPTFTAGDGTIFGGTYGNNSNATNVAIHSRDDANSLNQTFTETIRSRRTQIDNASKSMQNNLNQSNDTANQQSDAATTILQNLRTILNALYK